MATIGASVAIIRGGEILLTKREDFHVWCLPGGHLDPGETFPQAALREVREETGLDVTLDRLVGIYSRPRWGDHHTAVFTATPAGGEMHGQAGEVMEMAFFPPGALPAALLLGQRQRILDAAAGRSGLCRRERYPLPFGRRIPREDLYRLRDESGLDRAEFYARHFAILEDVSDVDRKTGLPELPGGEG